MVKNSPLRITLLFSVGFLSISLLLARAFVMGFLSPRALGITLLLVFVASLAVFTRIVAGLRTGSGIQGEDRPLDQAGRKRRLRQIRLGEIAIVILVVLLLNALFRLRHEFLLPQLVGIGMNILITITVARVVIRLQKSLKNTESL